MTGQQQWNRVTIIGCGLIGASFALALKRAQLCAVVAGWDKSSFVLDEALARGVIDERDELRGVHKGSPLEMTGSLFMKP